MLSPTVTRYGLLFLLTVQNTVTVLCLRSSMVRPKEEREDLNGLEYLSDSHNFVKKTDSAKYVVSTFVLAMEMIKLVALVLLTIVQMKCSIPKTIKLLYSEIACRPLDTLPLALPSFLYVLQDNLIIFALSCLDAATYQVTYQVRILTTALFARILLKQELPLRKWLALIILMIGVILAQLDFDKERGSFSFRSEKEGSSYFIGLACVGCATMTSGFAGVYNEKLIKDGQQPLLLIRSIQLSLFSIFFAFLGVVIKDSCLVATQGYFYGYTTFVWSIAVMQASGGIIVAATMKYADNILKTFATSNSIILSCICSYFLLGDLNLTITFIVGTIAIIFATVLYSNRAAESSPLKVYESKTAMPT